MRNWDEQIEGITHQFKGAFRGVSSDQLNWKPNSDTWSIAQNIDHLIVINESYFPIIDALHKGTYKPPLIGSIGFVVSFMGNTILKSVQPDRRKKIKTFPIWEPAGSEIPEGILDRFDDHQRTLKNKMANAADLLDKGAVISSPANRHIVYKLEKAFEIIIAHERRHFEQAQEVLQAMN